MQQRVVQVGFVIIAVVLAVLVVRLFQLQIYDGARYRKLAEENRFRIIKIPAPRGIIYDRNGIPLVENVPYFSVSIVPDSLKSLDIDRLASVLGLSVEELQSLIARAERSPFVPIRLKHGLDFNEVARIEARKSDFPGLFIETEIGREYPLGKVAAHLIGYLGRVPKGQASSPEFKNLPPDAMVGQWGVEKLYDADLRGTAGERIIEVNALGRELRLVQQRQPVVGKDVHLSIDVGIQKAVEHSFGEKAGAIVAINPQSGEILALESFPSFDPNVFAQGISGADWKELMESKKKPMLNRVLQSQYPPGSTFKIITAIAALEEGVIDPATRVNCGGGIAHGSHFFGCWKKGGHGPMDWHDALVNSCDVYFYEVGKRLGIDRLHKWAVAFGLGRETGLPLMKERPGLMPNEEWKKERRNLPWYLGDTYISSIGQGAVTTTPIQMAQVMASVANGGRIYKPTLIKGAYDPVRTVALKPDTVQRIRKALHDTVAVGTGKNAFLPYVSVGGKTGTVQVVSKTSGLKGEKYMDHAWFVAFAPTDAPEIAMAVFVEHGGGGGAVAAPIAKTAIDAYFGPKRRGGRPAEKSVPSRAAEQEAGSAQH
ncbi:MAG: penicillin-binding protein 2 [Nitrospiraceae bacterium]|jgi:penicillin-binding protein 2|nr:penicillin-binding protein 2 [Nitrospiraceae bacterium]